MSARKYLFVDRDGTIIHEPADHQIDSLEKLQLEPGVIPALLALQKAGYVLVMVSNQDGLGSPSFPQQDFDIPHQKLMQLLESQGIHFSDVKICPHTLNDGCICRKPNVGLVTEFMRDGVIDYSNSFVIGDRQTDLELAKNIHMQGILYGEENSWDGITTQLTTRQRTATVDRTTNETQIKSQINLDATTPIAIHTGIGFFDHMLEQLAKHGGFSLSVDVKGDLHIDQHHTIEDTALTIGQTLKKALGDKIGIARYGFLLAMDEALAQVAIDLSGRPYFVFTGKFPTDHVGELSCEMIPHFFRSLSESLGAAINIEVRGENTHHMVESIFKGVGRALRQALSKQSDELPTTKGLL